MKIAIVGAGAIGGYLGAKLASAGEDVTFIARNRNLEAIRANGFRLILEDASEEHAPTAKAVQRMLLAAVLQDQLEAIGADRLQVLVARDEGDVLARARQLGPEVAADRAGADNGDLQDRPPVQGSSAINERLPRRRAWSPSRAPSP